MTTYNLDSLLQFFKDSGWGFDAGNDTPHPERRDDAIEALERASIAAMADWAQDNVDSVLITDMNYDDELETHAEWEWGDACYQFSVTVPGLELADLWWMLESSVVYKHCKEHTIRVSRWEAACGYKVVEHCLSIEAQVLCATPTEGGIIVEMVASRFRDSESGEEWNQRIENGLGDWNYHEYMEKN